MGDLIDFLGEMYDEAHVSSVVAEGGELAGNVIGILLQDMSTFWVKDYSPDAGAFQGFHSFKTLRADPSPVNVPEAMILEEEFEIEVVHLEQPIDRVIFSFEDVERQFRQTTIQIDEDGQASEANNVKASVARMNTIIHYDVAARVAERRSQADLAKGARFKLVVGRNGRHLAPGQVITVAGISYVLRVAEVRFNLESSRTEVDCVLDSFGATLSDYEAPADGSSNTGGGLAPVANLAETFVEVPSHASPADGRMRIACLRIRGHAQVTGQIIHVSLDGSSYTALGTDTSVQAGGQLTSNMAADGDWEVAQGPTFDALGPDIALVLDLSSNEDQWRQGRQIALIGDEIFFLKKITALGGSSYRLDGLIRARLATEREAHAINDYVYILTQDQFFPFSDSVLFPGSALYVKQQPAVLNNVLSLGSVSAVSKTLKGKNVVPDKPAAFEVEAPYLGVFAFNTGDDVTFSWQRRSNLTMGTGAGSQPAGAAVGASALIGEFEIKLLTTGDVLKQTINQTNDEYTLTNANLVSWFGSEQSFKVQVRNVNGGYKSDPLEATITLE